MTHASLFSGIGGFDLSASWMGWKNLFTCEIDPFCNTILEYYFQNSKHYEDIKKTDFTEWRGKVDVLTGGFPCQPFSIAGKRKGKTDDRYLWPEMLRAIREIQPDWVVCENVDGIISMVQPGSEFEVESQFAMFEEDHTETVLEQEYVIETICRDIECEGYSVQPVIIPACAVGAPHRRYRVWFIAHRNSDDAGRYGYGETGCSAGKDKEIEKQRKRIRNEFERTCEERIASNSSCKRQSIGNDPEYEREIQSIEERAQYNRETDGLCSIKTSSNSTSERHKERTKYQTVEYMQNNGFAAFPTQSPVLCGDDGFSGGLDGITFLKWRNESIKSYGNTIVPQVVYEIFKSIKKVNEILKFKTT